MAEEETKNKLDDLGLLQKQFAALQESNKTNTQQQQACISQKEKAQQELAALKKTHANIEKELADTVAKVKALETQVAKGEKESKELHAEVNKLKVSQAKIETASKEELAKEKSRAEVAEAAARSAQLSEKQGKDEWGKVKMELGAREKDLAGFKAKEQEKINNLKAEMAQLRDKAAAASKVMY